MLVKTKFGAVDTHIYSVFIFLGAGVMVADMAKLSVLHAEIGLQPV